MSYKRTILTSLLIFSSSFTISAFGMETTNQSQATKVLKLSRSARRRAALQTQPSNNNPVVKGVAAVKSLSASFDKILNKKPQEKSQQKPWLQRSQKQDNNNGEVAVNSIQSEQPKQSKRSKSRRSNKNKTIHNAATVLAAAISINQQHDQVQAVVEKKSVVEISVESPTVIQSEQKKEPVQRRRRNRVKATQDAAAILATNIVLQNKQDKRIQQRGDKKRQNIQPIAIKEQKNIVIEKQGAQIEIIDSEDRVCICDHLDDKEIILFKEVKDILSPGTYYRTPDGLKLVPKNLKSNNGLFVVKNHCSHLRYADNAKLKMCMTNDIRHSFSTKAEREFGNCARIIIHNSINNPDQIKNNKKRFDLYVTVPGVINKIEYKADKKIIVQEHPGVFELMVKKSLYQNHGDCYHRFLAPKGIVGADDFGARARQKICNKQITL